MSKLIRISDRNTTKLDRLRAGRLSYDAVIDILLYHMKDKL